MLIFCSAAILALPVSGSEPTQDAINAEEHDDDAADVFPPKKRDRRIWFDVPTRGGCGMIHLTKRKCPEIMFKYLNHLSSAAGRGWKFEQDEDDDVEVEPPIQVMRSLLHDPSLPQQFGTRSFYHVSTITWCCDCV